MFPILQIGPFSLPAPELVLVLSFYLALFAMEKLIQSQQRNPDVYSNMLLYSLLIFFLAGRLGYIFSHLNAFSGSPSDIFSLNRDLFDPWIGAVGALLFLWITLQRQKIQVTTALDDLAIFIAIVLFGIGLSDLASGNAFGTESDVPWAIQLWGLARHPVQAYQIILNISIILILLTMIKNNGSNNGLFLIFCLFTSASYFFLSTFRAEGYILPGGYRAAQLLWWVVFVVIYWFQIKQKSKSETAKVVNNG